MSSFYQWRGTCADDLVCVIAAGKPAETRRWGFKPVVSDSSFFSSVPAVALEQGDGEGNTEANDE
jgi:hypothetical protein